MKNPQLAMVGIKRVLMICVVLLIIFSASGGATDFIVGSWNICKEIHGVDVSDAIDAYVGGYINQDKVLEGLFLARDSVVKSLGYWTILRREEPVEIKSLTEVVLIFFAARIGMISYAIHMIEEGKIKRGTYERAVLSYLMLAEGCAYGRVLDEVGRLKGWK